jgi:Ca2+-binding RTX toxin-like protein
MAGVFVGTNNDDVLKGTYAADLIYGLNGSDTVDAGGGDDLVSGGTGDSPSNADAVAIAADFKGQIVLQTPAKGVINPVGMYKIDAAGNIMDVRILWNGGGQNGKGSGNATTLTVIDADLKAGEKYGFFALSNGYGSGNGAKLLADAGAKWELRDLDGGTGQIGDKGLRLWHVDGSGKKTAVSTSADHKIFHSAGSEANGYAPNPDGQKHAVTKVDYLQGVVTIALEAGGTKDFGEAVIKFCVGTDNALAVNADSGSGKGNADWLNGGDGNDKMLGLGGHDVMVGGNGADTLYGNSGNDTVSGDAGNDTINGGKDHDVLAGGADDDRLFGNTGNDVVSGDEGSDVLRGGKGHDSLAGGDGNDTVYGNTGDDVIYAGLGDDLYVGGAGRDTLNFSLSANGVSADLDKNSASGMGSDILDGIENLTGSDWNDTLIGDKEENVISGGKGNDIIAGKRGDDVLTGGQGDDTFTWFSRKDAAGENYTDDFVDVIKDFGAGDKLDFTGFKLDLKNGIAGAVSIVDEADGAHVYAKFGTMGMVEIVVLEDVSGLDVTDLYNDGLLLV